MTEKQITTLETSLERRIIEVNETSSKGSYDALFALSSAILAVKALRDMKTLGLVDDE